MDNRRLFLAVLLSLAVLLLWQLAFPPQPPQRAPESTTAETSAESAERSRSDEAREATSSDAGETDGVEPGVEALEPVAAETEEIVEVGAGAPEARLTNRGGQLLSLRRLAKADTDERVELVRHRADDQPFPFAWVRPDGTPMALNGALFEVERSSGAGQETVDLYYRGPEGEASKRFVFEANGLFHVEVKLEGEETGWGVLVGPGLRNPGWDFLDDRFQTRGVVYREGGDVESILARKTDEPERLAAGGFDWIGLEDTYFLSVMLPERPLLSVEVLPVTVTGEGQERLGYERWGEGGEADGPDSLELVLIPGREELNATAFWGAKNYDQLVEVGAGLERTVRWGFLRPLARMLQIGVNWIHANVVSNYGWCIVLMTVLIKLLLLPLTHKSQVSMQKMQKLNPQMEAIRKKYRPKLKDKQGRPDFEMQRKMNEEMQGLFREHGVNPAGGCLPLLLQMPVFFSFYYLLRGAVELWHAPWIGWIQDLSAPDPYFVLPVVMGVTQLAQTRMMPPASNPAQRFILTSMPIWFTIFALGFPSGLVLYWLTNNVLTIIHQGGYNRLKKAGYFGGPDPEPESKPTSRKGKKKR